MDFFKLCNSPYRRGRTRHGESEVKLPPEMELSNQILVTSKEGGLGDSTTLDTNSEGEEDAEEVEANEKEADERLVIEQV